jgi:hypothetical protein
VQTLSSFATLAAKLINVKKLFSLKIFSMGQITHRKPQKSFLLSCHTCQRFSGIVICISASPYNQRGIVRSLLTKPENFGNQNFIACWHKLCLLLFTSLVVWTRRNANDYTTKTLASMARQQK